MHWRSSPLISRNWNGSLTATGCPRSKFGVLVLFWESLKVGDAKLLLPNATAMKPPSTEPVNGIDTWDLPACFRMSDEAIRDVTGENFRSSARSQSMATAAPTRATLDDLY